MYSYEDRSRAVELYIKLDKRIAATLKPLGYPTKSALKTWYRDYEQRQDVVIFNKVCRQMNSEAVDFICIKMRKACRADER